MLKTRTRTDIFDNHWEVLMKESMLKIKILWDTFICLLMMYDDGLTVADLCGKR